MKIASLCTRRVVTIDGGSSLTQAATLMREHHVGALVVTTQSGGGTQVSGIVTDRDLVIDVLSRGLDVAAVRIGTLVGPRLVSVREQDTLGDAIAAMQDGGVRRLLVTDADGHLRGILSMDDLLGACAQQLDALAGVIRAGIERELAAAPPTPPLPPTLQRIPAMGTAGWRPAPGADAAR